MPQFRTFPQAIQPCMALVPMWTISAPMPSASSVRATSDKAIKVFPSLWGLPFISNTFIVVMFVFVQI